MRENFNSHQEHLYGVVLEKIWEIHSRIDNGTICLTNKWYKETHELQLTIVNLFEKLDFPIETIDKINIEFHSLVEHAVYSEHTNKVKDLFLLTYGV